MGLGLHNFRTNGIIINLLQTVIINLMTYYLSCCFLYNPSVGTQFS